jgi:hypothetical protein
MQRITIDPVKLKLLETTPPWEWPPDAGDTFKKLLRDRGAPESDRIIAAELSGDMVVVDNEIAGLLIGIVSNSAESDTLRSRAAIALGPVLEQTDIDQFDEDLLPEEFREEPAITMENFERIKSALHDVYKDETVPKLVRRRVLEASVRAEADWHADAIRAAFASGDEDWKLTAVFAMSYVQGDNEQILESLKSANADIHREAVRAAGNRELAQAWPHIEGLLKSAGTPKPLLLAAIAAAVGVNPVEAEPLLTEWCDSDDEEIAEAADEALMEASGAAGDFADDEEDEDEDEDEIEGGGYIN